jgi:hypothetical protein
MSKDRFNGFNGLLKRKAKLITFLQGRLYSVIGEIYNRGISLRMNDNTKKFVKYYSFYQQRLFGNNASIVSEALKKNKLPKDWSAGFNPEPSPDCCIYFKGESENLVTCIASADGQNVETASDICRIKIKSIFSDISNSLRGIKFAESYHELLHNKVKLADCKSPEYKNMQYRAHRTIPYAINVDCKFVMNYINGDDFNKKFQFCYKNYGDELELEHKLMSLDNDSIYESINKCVFESAEFKKNFQESTFIGKKIFNFRIHEKS